MRRTGFWMNGAVMGAIAAITLGGSTGSAMADDKAPDDQWVKLGEVEFDADDNTKEKRVSLDFEDSAFTHLKFHAQDSDVRIRMVAIQFAGGGEQVVNLDDMVEEGENSRIINLKGDKRKIDRLSITAVTVDDDDDDAEIVVYGMRH